MSSTGYRHTPAARKAIGKAQRARVRTDEECDRMSAAARLVWRQRRLRAVPTDLVEPDERQREQYHASTSQPQELKSPSPAQS